MGTDITRERYGPWAIVAGASEGIGAAFSRRLAEHGIDLALIGRREPPLVELSEEIRSRYGVATRAISLDLSAAAAERTLFDTTADLEVGLVIYNAGGDDHGDVCFLEVEPEVWAAMVRRNCLVPMLAAHHYGARMVERGRGGLLLVSSGAAWAGGARLAPYGATKAFDLVLGEALWAEWRDHGVDVLSLVVGATDTPPSNVCSRHTARRSTSSTILTMSPGRVSSTSPKDRRGRWALPTAGARAQSAGWRVATLYSSTARAPT